MTVTVYITNAGETQSGLLLIVAFSNLHYLNMSLNFYLYLLSGQMFRQEVNEFLERCFRCTRSKAGGGGGHKPADLRVPGPRTYRTITYNRASERIETIRTFCSKGV